MARDAVQKSLSDARTVLTAMREPSEVVHDAGNAAVTNVFRNHDYDLPGIADISSRRAFIAMIDAALAEGG